ncbi:MULTISPECIES: DsbA family protein [Bartonella]|uniref:DsbA family protein n=1 Tax=Bartonella TaxID=773 RepID=UPI0018DDEFA7|nr:MULTISPECIES: DsbA family protein [Bartonella]MBH9994815.1 DsbA family protein [Bartonella sp. P0291]MBH9996840.1 DsbA family protein [Bartonella sp. M0192]MBH9999000.1 DsbA family protein [Bartonella sp. M0191]MBI0007379.1 DsbA family protein [Bartonella sp. M0193]MBI0010291.1 DsbA family protein [Bartonella sp. M0176]
MLNTKNSRRLRCFAAAFGMAATTCFAVLPSFGADNKPAETKTVEVKSNGTVDMTKLLEPGKGKEMVEGKADAPVTIVEYASLTCSHCGDFYRETLPSIRDKYIKTGKARLVFREFAYDARAQAGYMLARCVPEDRYFPMLQVLFERQMEWAAADDALPPLKKIAAMAGLDENGVDACLKNQSVLDEVKSSFERGKEFGVTSTPTFFINGKKYEGALSVDEMSSVIDSFLK